MSQTETKPKAKTTQTKKVEEKKEPLTKRQRFLKNGEYRANKVIDRLQLLGRIADNPQNYEYTEEDIETIFLGIEEMTLDMKNKFLSTLKVEDIAEKRRVTLE